VNNVRREACRYFKKEKKREYVKEKTDELATHSKNNNTGELYRGINYFRRATNLELTW
jgi:hypothetical protein